VRATTAATAALFSEPECGHHYGRARAAWNVRLAWTGFHYSAVEGVLTFGPRPGRHFWSTCAAWGDITLSGKTATLRFLAGPLNATLLTIPTVGSARLPGLLRADTTLTLT
jgi:non-lysosomal glucosylceramidase